MRVVERKELMELIKVKEVLFSNVSESGLDGLYEASYFSDDDFVITNLIEVVEGLDELWLTYEHITSVDNFSLDLECGCRDGLYDDKDKYAIYEKEDVEKLINRLNKFRR